MYSLQAEQVWQSGKASERQRQVRQLEAGQHTVKGKGQRDVCTQGPDSVLSNHVFVNFLKQIYSKILAEKGISDYAKLLSLWKIPQIPT